MQGTDMTRHILIVCTVALVLTTAASASAGSAQGFRTSAVVSLPTMVGIYFDTEATQTVKVCNGGADEFYTAYIFIMNAPRRPGGAAYQLALDPRIQLIGATYPPGVHLGNPLVGIQVGFTDCFLIGTPTLVSTLTLWAGNSLVDNAEIRIDPYPPAGAVEFADCDGVIDFVAGGSAFLTIPISAEAMTWSTIKALYGS